MTGGEPMRCEDARELLVDLACGEPLGALGPRVQEHAQSCPQCGPELAKFSRVLEIADQLPLSEPSPRVEGRVMLAAREALEAHGGSAPARGFSQGASKKPTTWFGRLSRWAMSPQVAMASVLLLMVGIGLYALPLGRKQRQVAFETAREERVAPEPAASAIALPPAEEQRALEELERSDQEARKLAPASAQRVSEQLASAARHKGGAPGEPMPERKRRTSKSVAADQPTDLLSGALAEDEAAPAPSKPSNLKTSGGLARGGGGTLGASGAGATAPAAQASSAAREGGALQDSRRPSSFAPPPPAKAEAPTAPAPADQGDWASALQQGVAAARAGSYAEAMSMLEPVSRQAPPQMRRQAQRWLAYSLRAQGNCAGAIRYYDFLVRSAQTGADVLREAADCFERVGDAKRAEELRTRASDQ